MIRWLRARLCDDAGSKAYRRAQLDTLASVRLDLEPTNPCHDRIRDRIDDRIRLLSGTPPA